MATYLDLSGTDERFLVGDHRIKIFPISGGNAFVVNLNRPAYEHTVVVRNAENTPFVTLNKGIDWVVRTTDIDYNAMGKAKLADPNFNFTLVKSITVLLTPNPSLTVSLSYNTLEMSYVTENAQGVEDVHLTPELIYELSRDVAYLKDSRNPIENLMSESNSSVPILEVDYIGDNPNNLVQGEVHTLNSQTGRVYIHPRGGAYYKDSLEVRVTNTGQLLNKGVDYRVICCNLHKTSLTSNTSGVYDVIHVTTGIVGNVTIKYQAFGGEVTPNDISSIFKTMVNIIQYINGAAFLTPSTIGNTSIFLHLTERLNNLEESVRILSTGGTPTYADSTNGKSFLHKFKSLNSNIKEWFTIAKLYKVAGSSMVYTKSSCRYKIMCSHSGLMFDVVLSADINNTVTPLNINVLSTNDKLQYTPYQSYANINQQITPEFRLLWNSGTGVESGALLQIGFKLTGISEETVALEDWSGAESCWIAVSPTGVATAPDNDNMILPNGSAVWSSASSNSRQAVVTYTPKRGYLVWGGNLSLKNTVINAATLTPIGNSVVFTGDNITKVVFHIWNKTTGNMVKVFNEVVPTSAGAIRCSNLFYPEDTCAILFTFAKSGSNYTMTIKSILGSSSETNDVFELREITLEF